MKRLYLSIALACIAVFAVAQVSIINEGGVSIGTEAEILSLSGTNMWVDSMVPATATRLGASQPSWINFNSGNQEVLGFNNNQDDAVHFTLQLNHDYRDGTDIRMHVHWTPTATTGAGDGGVWELEYQWQSIGSVFPASATVTITNDVGSNWQHQMSTFAAIDGTSKGDSSILVCRLRRLASSNAADDYDQDAAFIGVDAHYQVDSIGSTLP